MTESIFATSGTPVAIGVDGAGSRPSVHAPKAHIATLAKLTSASGTVAEFYFRLVSA